MQVHGHLVRQPKWYQFMLDIAWPELMIIGIVAVVAIGPKDLPKVMNNMGRWTAKARHMVADVRRSFEQLQYEAEIAERLPKEAEAHMRAAATAHHPATQHAAAPNSAHTAAVKEEPHDHLGST